MNKEKFIDEIKSLGIFPTEKQLLQLEKYYNLLIEWNKKVNLTAITSKEDVYLKHFYDSLSIISVIPLNESLALCDIGTGAGFPGIVLKIFFPDLKITLVDSLKKRTLFLEEIIRLLDLEKIEVKNVRAENYAAENREKFDLVVARAVSKMSVLLELCTPLLKVNSYFIAYKASTEEYYSNATKLLNLRLLEKKQFCLPVTGDERALYVFKKEAITNKKFPRKYADIKKKPLL